jgi:hypothetical protein
MGGLLKLIWYRGPAVPVAHLASEVLDAVKILKPETIIRWHRAGFRAWWRWKSRPRGGRPRTPDEIRRLIREINMFEFEFPTGTGMMMSDSFNTRIWPLAY